MHSQDIVPSQKSIKNPKNCLQNIDKKKLINLIIGVIGILVTFSISSIFVQLIVKHKYKNRFTGKYQLCGDYFGYNFIHSLYVCILGKLMIILFIRKPNQSRENQRIPWKYAILSGITMAFGNICSMNAVHQTSFAVITIFKACSILSVILVGVFCTRVRDHRLQLGKQKFIGAFFIACFIFLFQFFDPETRNRSLKSELLGIVFLLGSIFADGFYPDFQAKMKTQNRILQPMAMMIQIHFTILLINFAAEIIEWSLVQYFKFMYEHPLYIVHLFGQITFSFIGQIFVYRMIKQFKQHIVPFTVTSRKILSVFWSILFFGHPTNWIQILSVLGILATVCFEFNKQISKNPVQFLQKQGQAENQDTNEQNEEFTSDLNRSLLTQSNLQQSQQQIFSQKQNKDENMQEQIKNYSTENETNSEVAKDDSNKHEQ